MKQNRYGKDWEEWHRDMTPPQIDEWMRRTQEKDWQSRQPRLIGRYSPVCPPIPEKDGE